MTVKINMTAIGNDITRSCGVVCYFLKDLLLGSSTCLSGEIGMHTTVSNALHEHILVESILAHPEFSTGLSFCLIAGSLRRTGVPFSSTRRVVVYDRSRQLCCSRHRLRARNLLPQTTLVCMLCVQRTRKICCTPTCCN